MILQTVKDGAPDENSQVLDPSILLLNPVSPHNNVPELLSHGFDHGSQTKELPSVVSKHGSPDLINLVDPYCYEEKKIASYRNYENRVKLSINSKRKIII